MGGFRRVVSCGLVLAMAAPSAGCMLVALAAKKKEPIDSAVVEVRVSSRQADVSGQRCYVDHKVRTSSRVHEDRMFGMLGLLEGVVGGGAAIDGQVNNSNTETGVGLAMLLDGIVGAMLVFHNDDSVDADEAWEPTSDTATCLP